MPILVFLGLSVLDLGPMYATDRGQTDRETDVKHASSVNASDLWGRWHNNLLAVFTVCYIFGFIKCLTTS